MKASNDKQKMMVVGGLFVVMVAVGAFQFMGSSPAPAPKKEEVKEEGTGVEPTVNTDNARAVDPRYAVQLPTRDPFEPQMGALATNKTPAADAQPLTPTAPVEPELPAPPMPELPNYAAAPPSMSGNLSPMDPNQMGQLPAPGGNNSNSGMNPEANDRGIASYRVSGVVTGPRAVAILVDGNGKQRMVKVGDSFEGRKVLSIKNGEVILEEGSSSSTKTKLVMDRDVES